MGNDMSTNEEPEQPVVLPASGQHSATLIFMHGIGDSGQSWGAVFQVRYIYNRKINK
jgi:hypothetical protein